MVVEKKKYEPVGKIILGSLANVLCSPEKLCVQGNAKHFSDKHEDSQGKRECKISFLHHVPLRAPYSTPLSGATYLDCVCHS